MSDFLLGFLTFEVGTDRLSRNVCNELPLPTALIAQKIAVLKRAIH